MKEVNKRISKLAFILKIMEYIFFYILIENRK